MKIKANICISRDSSDTMRVKVQDETSRATFLEMEFTTHDLMMALTGLAYVDATVAEVRDLDVVGKQKIIERRSVKYPHSDHDSRADKEKWLAENCKEDGWIVAPYLGSQTSISRRDGETILNYSVYRYEAQEQSHD
jgi:hypothetical protein